MPPELGRCGSLETLRLAGNLLSGAVPAGLGNATSLEVLDLEINRLTGTERMSLYYRDPFHRAPLYLRDPFHRAPLYFMENFAKLHPYFRRCASGSERERHCARISRKFRENTVAPYATLPYARASKAHRPTKLNLQNLLN